MSSGLLRCALASSRLPWLLGLCCALDKAYLKHPQRFSKGRPKVQMPPQEVYINPIPEGADEETIEKGVNFPTLQRVIEKHVNY